MPNKTVAQKMGVRAGARAHFVDAPLDVVGGMGLPELSIHEELNGAFDYLHLFVTEQDSMRRRLPVLKEHLRSGGMLWVSWPKGGRLGTDLRMQSVIGIGYSFGLVENMPSCGHRVGRAQVHPPQTHEELPQQLRDTSRHALTGDAVHGGGRDEAHPGRSRARGSVAVTPQRARGFTPGRWSAPR